jgi:hypothetical protein
VAAVAVAVAVVVVVVAAVAADIGWPVSRPRSAA